MVQENKSGLLLRDKVAVIFGDGRAIGPGCTGVLIGDEHYATR
jgi:hypothetical protein